MRVTSTCDDASYRRLRVLAEERCRHFQSRMKRRKMPTSSCLLFVVFAGNITLLNLIVDDDSCRISDGQKWHVYSSGLKADGGSPDIRPIHSSSSRCYYLWSMCLFFFSLRPFQVVNWQQWQSPHNETVSTHTHAQILFAVFCLTTSPTDCHVSLVHIGRLNETPDSICIHSRLFFFVWFCVF